LKLADISLRRSILLGPYVLGLLSCLGDIPGDIAAFYDDLCERVDRNTPCLRIKGLKKYFEGVKRVIPFYEIPFEIRKKRQEKARAALSGLVPV
jgi:hypothetical protein